MKILYVISGLMKGGAETQLFNLVTNLPEGTKVKIITFRKGYYYDILVDRGYEVECYNLNSIFQLFGVLRFLRKEIKVFSPDLVHTWLPHANILTKISMIGLGSTYKLVTSIRVKEIKYFFHNLFDRIFDFKSDLTIVNSKSIKRYLLSKFLFNANKVKVVNNGLSLRTIDNNVLKSLQKHYNNKKIILTIAAFRKQKDYVTNVLVSRDLLKLRGDFLFLYVGEFGPEFHNIKNLVDKYNLGRYIKFLGRREDVPELFNIADVFFLPTLYEGQANVLIESMYNRCPIVTTNIDENRELVKYAEFCKVKDYKNMALRINKILDNGYSELKLKSNKELVEKNFILEEMVRKYYKLYTGLIK